jgi:hypothetical protein
MDAGIQLPPNTTATVLRPISALPGDELQCATWAFVHSIAPERGPASPLVGKICRVIKNAIEDVEPTAAGQHAPRSSRNRTIESPERETPWIRPVERLAAWSGFSVEVIVSNVTPPSAIIVYRACGTLAQRCQAVRERLSADYPELASHA